MSKKLYKFPLKVFLYGLPGMLLTEASSSSVLSASFDPIAAVARRAIHTCSGRFSAKSILTASSKKDLEFVSKRSFHSELRTPGYKPPHEPISLDGLETTPIYLPSSIRFLDKIKEIYVPLHTQKQSFVHRDENKSVVPEKDSDHTLYVNLKKKP